jgi:hypothetical protein
MIGFDPNHGPPGGQIFKLALPIIFIRGLYGGIGMPAMPEHGPNIQTGWNRLAIISAAGHLFDFIGRFQKSVSDGYSAPAARKGCLKYIIMAFVLKTNTNRLVLF